MGNTDEKLISDILTGDVEAYAILVKRYQKPIFNLMMRTTSCEEDAFDLTQEAFKERTKSWIDSNLLVVFSHGFIPSV